MIGVVGAVVELVVELAAAAVAGGAVLRGTVGGDGALFGDVNEAAVVGMRLFGEFAVALGAADAHFLPGGVVGVGVRVVVLVEVGHVAPGALDVPCHAAVGPVAPIDFGAFVAAEDVEPFLLVWIPAGAGGLPAAIVVGDEVLDEGIDAEGHLGLVGLSVDVDGGFVVGVGEGPFLGGGFEGEVGEGFGVLFGGDESVGEAVVGVLPFGVGILVAFLAAFGDGRDAGFVVEGGAGVRLLFRSFGGRRGGFFAAGGEQEGASEEQEGDPGL